MTRQGYLSDFESDDEDDRLDVLTEAERDAYEAVREGEFGVREFADETDRSPGTVGNLLERAERKLGGETEAAAATGGN